MPMKRVIKVKRNIFLIMTLMKKPSLQFMTAQTFKINAIAAVRNMWKIMIYVISFSRERKITLIKKSLKRIFTAKKMWMICFSITMNQSTCRTIICNFLNRLPLYQKWYNKWIWSTRTLFRHQWCIKIRFKCLSSILKMPTRFKICFITK